MVRALFFLLIAFRVTVCPVVCASGGDFGYCCHGCAFQAGDGQKDECSDAGPASQPGEGQAAQLGCQCCTKDDCSAEDAARDRFAEELVVIDAGPKAPAGEDGICNGECACKVLPEKGKTQIDLRACFAIGTWNCADDGATAIKSCSLSLSKLLVASPPDGKTLRIARCSLLI